MFHFDSVLLSFASKNVTRIKQSYTHTRFIRQHLRTRSIIKYKRERELCEGAFLVVGRGGLVVVLLGEELVFVGLNEVDEVVNVTDYGLNTALAPRSVRQHAAETNKKAEHVDETVVLGHAELVEFLFLAVGFFLNQVGVLGSFELVEQLRAQRLVEVIPNSQTAFDQQLLIFSIRARFSVSRDDRRRRNSWRNPQQFILSVDEIAVVHQYLLQIIRNIDAHLFASRKLIRRLDVSFRRRRLALS